MSTRGPTPARIGGNRENSTPMGHRLKRRKQMRRESIKDWGDYVRLAKIVPQG